MSYVRNTILISLLAAGICGCGGGVSVAPSTQNEFAVELQSAQGAAVASAAINSDGTCVVQVPNVPANPTSQLDYAKIALSRNRGSYSPKIADAEFRINLNPDMADNCIYLEGYITNNMVTGRWHYATFAGYTSMGSFSGNVNP